MSTESVRQFLLAVSSDSALQEKLAAVTDSVNFVQMVQACGYSFTLEDLQAHLAEHNNSELSEDELEAVAGGGDSFSLDIPLHPGIEPWVADGWGIVIGSIPVPVPPVPVPGLWPKRGLGPLG